MKFEFFLDSLITDETYWDISGYVKSAIEELWFHDEHDEMMAWLKKTIEEGCL